MKNSEPEAGDSKDSPKRFSQRKRRQFIVRQLRSTGILSLAKLNNEAPTPLSSSVISEDIDVLNQMGFAIIPVESEGRTYLVDSSARHIGSKAERMGLHSNEKQNIAIAACSLILGIPEPGAIARNTGNQKPGRASAGEPKFSSQDAHERLLATNPEIAHLWSRATIFSKLVTANSVGIALEKARHVMQICESVWAEGVVNVFCDAGTTNERLGGLLRDVLIPTSFSKLDSLTLCTNSRSIFNLIADPEVSTKAVIVGGSQMGVDGVTEALSGPLSELFLKATVGHLDFSFAFIGATAVDVGAGFVLSDSFEEKRIKETVMSGSRSQLRIVCADRTKLLPRPVRAGFRVCSLSPNQVDLIITNAPSRDAKIVVDDMSVKMIDIIRNRGIPVMEAEFECQRQPLAEMQRGELFRSRLPFYKAEALFQQLGFGRREDFPFHSRAMEIWLNVMTDYFLTMEDDAERKKLVKKVKELRDKTFLGLLENRSVLAETSD